MAKYMELTASGQIKSRPGQMFGLFIASASGSPTLKVWDSLTASGTVMINTFTPVAGQTYFFGASAGNIGGVDFTTGCYVTVGGTVDCTVFYD